MLMQPESLLTVVSLCVAEAEQRIARQRERVERLKANGQSTEEARRTLDVMVVVAACMKDSQALIRLQLSPRTLH